MIYLLRHGEIDSDGEKRFIGWTNLPLNAIGVQQARRWQEEFSGMPFDGIYCSHLDRTRRTASIISERQRAEVNDIPALKEINLGAWEGLAMSEVKLRFPDEWRERGKNIFRFRPPGGESFSDLCERVIPVFESIATAATGNTLIVAHAGVNRMILCRLLGMPAENLFRIGQDYACLNRIDCRTIPYRVVSVNVTLW
jgi:alpha-ribazole phosphatase